MRDTLSDTFQALADPTRRAILDRLGRGDATVGELAQPFGISLPAVSRHLKVLEAAGLIAREREAQWRRCRLNPEAFSPLVLWIEQTRAFWRGSLDRLDDYLNLEQSREGDDVDRDAAAGGGEDEGGDHAGTAPKPEGDT